METPTAGGRNNVLGLRDMPYIGIPCITKLPKKFLQKEKKGHVGLVINPIVLYICVICTQWVAKAILPPHSYTRMTQILQLPK